MPSPRPALTVCWRPSELLAVSACTSRSSRALGALYLQHLPGLLMRIAVPGTGRAPMHAGQATGVWTRIMMSALQHNADQFAPGATGLLIRRRINQVQGFSRPRWGPAAALHGMCIACASLIALHYHTCPGQPDQSVL